MLKPNQIALIAVLPATAKSIAKATSRREKSVHNALKKLHEDEEIHISAWSATSRRPAAVYSVGPGEDKARPISRRMSVAIKRGAIAEIRTAPKRPIKVASIVAQAMQTPSSIWAYAQQQ